MIDPARFYHQVERQVIELQEQISQLGSIATVGGERLDATEAIRADIARLTVEVADASDELPSYDQRHYAEAIKRLTQMLNEEVSRLYPKQSFRFKPRAASGISAHPENDPRLLRGKPDAAEPQDAVGSLPAFAKGKNYNEELAQSGRHRQDGVRKPSFSTARTVDLRDHQGLHIILPLTAAKATSSGSLQNLTDCIVDMSEPAVGVASFASLAIRNLERCLVVAGNVNGPAHITGVKNSVLVVSARQVRLHDCYDVRIYLYCSSRPIIEDCKGMMFAPLPSRYIPETVDPATNQWDQVDDFKWLKADHSPNWDIIPEDKRLPDSVWNDVLKGRPGLGPKDMLKEVGIESTLS